MTKREGNIGFNVDHPSDSFRQFRKDVFQSIQEADVATDEQYPTALFLVTRDDAGAIVDIDDLVTDWEVDEDTPISYIMQTIFPAVAKAAGCRYFGIVFPGEQLETFDDDEPTEIVIVLTGSLNNIDMAASEIERNEEHNYSELGPWEKVNLAGFDDIVIPFRRAVTLQG